MVFYNHFNYNSLKVFYSVFSVPADNGSPSNATKKDGNSSEPAQTQNQSSGMITVIVIVGPIVALIVLAGVSK